MLNIPAFISTKELANLLNIHYQTASTHIKIIKFHLNKKKHQKITLNEISEYYGIQENIIINKLYTKNAQ